MSWRNLRVDGAGRSLTLPKTNTLEIHAEIVLTTAEGIDLAFKNGPGGAQPLILNFSHSEFKVMDASAALPPDNGGRRLSLRIFIDRSVLEVFANGIVCVTKVIAPLEANPTLEIHAQGGSANARQIEAWPMKSIWPAPASEKTGSL